MAYNSSGVFSRLFDWTDDRDNGIKIRADRFDQELDGFATGLTTTLLKDGTQTATAIIPFAVGLSIIDNQSAIFGTNSDYTLQYDEATRDALILASNVEGAAFKLTLAADQGDDASDEWQVGISTGGVLSIGNDIASAQTYVSQLTLTPHATVASSTTAVLGNLTVGGSLSLGSAVIAEAELEMLDGITAGTVIASKAIVTDSDLDITGGRNITITGELDAATGDFSGDVDVDGTLEADAITVNGTALATVIAGTTVTNATNAVNATNATNSAHVLVTDNESTNEENLIAFVEGATSTTGNVGLEMDGNFAYNPSTGTVSAIVFKGNIDAVDGDFDGTLEADAITIGGTAIGSIFSPIAGGTGIVTTGALDTGSITSGFGTINNGASAITTTGAVGTGALTAGGLVTAGAKLDLNGTELILDADADTSITADTDNQIDIKIAGADDFTFTANTFTALSGSGVVIPDGGLTLGSTALTSTATELNQLDGKVAKTAGKESIWVPAGAMYPSTTNGCSALTQVETTALRPDLKVLDFAAAADDFAQFSIAFPKSWNEGTITYQPFWTVTGTNTGTVVWQLGGIAVTSDATINTAFGTLIATTALAHSGTSNDLMVSAESGAVTIAGSPSTDDVCFFQINNDAGAAGQTGVVRLLGIKIFFTTDAANDA